MTQGNLNHKKAATQERQVHERVDTPMHPNFNRSSTLDFGLLEL